MLANLPNSTLFIVFAALAPGCFGWWYGRGLARAVDDPLLPERLSAARLRGRYVLTCAWALLVVGWPDDLYWSIPLTILVRAIAAYPLRRVLQGETWSLPAYLWFFIRLTLAVYGFWLTLLSLPELARLAGSRDWVVGAVIACVLWCWNARYPPVVCALLGTKPVGNAEVVSRFTQIAATASLRLPRFEMLEVRGGVLANAVALPSRATSVVLVTSSLLERFDLNEIAAVCAHELAHIEQYNPRRLRRLNLGTSALIAAGALATPVARVLAPSSLTAVFLLWFVFVVLYLSLRARSRQKEETASDLRAVSWTGDPEALISALIKLHTIGRVPRRWDARFERHATHPSLARRIQAIRSAAAHAPAILDAPAVFVSGATSVVFHADRLEWNEADLLTHTIGYARLTELRLAPSTTGLPRLIALEKSGRRWETALAADDVVRAQSVLDIVDVRLAATDAPPAIPSVALRLLTILTVLAAVATTQVAVVVPAMLAMLRPATAIVASVGVGAVTGALLALRTNESLGVDAVSLWAAIALGVCGGALLVLSWTTRKDEGQPAVIKAFMVLGAFTALGGIGILLAGVDAVSLHRAARAWPSTIVWALGLAAGLAVCRSRPARYLSVPVALLGVSALVAGSRPYLERFGSDPFLAPVGPLTMRTVTGNLLSESPIPVRGGELKLSPAGQSVAVSSDDGRKRRVFYAGHLSGPFVALEGDNAFFVDDDHLLLLDRHPGEGVVVREVGLDGAKTVWEQRIAGVASAKLWLNQRTRLWRVLGRTREGEVVRAEGIVGDRGVDDRRWPAPQQESDDEDLWVDAVAASRTHVLMRRTHYDRGAFTGVLGILSTLLDPEWMESDFWVLGPGGSRTLGTSRLDVHCEWIFREDDRPVCAAFDGTRTTLFALDFGREHLEAFASLNGRLYGVRDAGSGWLSGWWNTRPVVIFTAAREGWQLASSGREWVRSVSATEHLIGTLSMQGASAVVRVYEAR